MTSTDTGMSDRAVPDRALRDSALLAVPDPALPDPAVHAAVLPAPAGPGPVAGHAFHRLPRAFPHRGYWWRPLVAVAVATVVYVVMVVQLTVPVLGIGGLWPQFATTEAAEDPLNPADQFLSLGTLALMIPAVLIGTLAGYGRAGIAHSVLGRFRWALLGRAAFVVIPVYVLVNLVASLVLHREAIEVPVMDARVLTAWLLVLVLAPLQSAGEEYAFRALPMQAAGTWLRRPIFGILLPVPLFVLGHGYSWLGQVDIALFAIVMGLLAWKTGGLEIPILLHAANNWTLFAVAPLIPGFTEQGEVTGSMLVLSLAPMLLISAGIWWWYSRREGLGLWEPQCGSGQTLVAKAAMTSRPRSVAGKRSTIA